MTKWTVPDPMPTRLRAWWCRMVWCRIVGHDTLTKMDGTILCRRH